MNTTPTNDDRALWAEQAMMKFARVTRMDTAGEDDETILSDLLANLMHMARLKEINWDEVYNRATSHFEEEVQEEEGGA